MSRPWNTVVTCDKYDNEFSFFQTAPESDQALAHELRRDSSESAGEHRHHTGRWRVEGHGGHFCCQTRACGRVENSLFIVSLRKCVHDISLSLNDVLLKGMVSTFANWCPNLVLLFRNWKNFSKLCEKETLIYFYWESIFIGNPSIIDLDSLISYLQNKRNARSPSGKLMLEGIIENCAI